MTTPRAKIALFYALSGQSVFNPTKRVAYSTHLIKLKNASKTKKNVEVEKRAISHLFQRDQKCWEVMLIQCEKSFINLFLVWDLLQSPGFKFIKKPSEKKTIISEASLTMHSLPAYNISRIKRAAFGSVYRNFLWDTKEMSKHVRTIRGIWKKLACRCIITVELSFRGNAVVLFQPFS